MSTFPISSSASFSSSPLPTPDDNRSRKQDVIRKTVNFHPSIWGDQFLTYHEKRDLVIKKQHVGELKEMRKKLKITDYSEPMQHMKVLELIDAVQRLSIAYHFEEEIEETLQYMYATYGDKWIHNNNLQTTSLWFRILRQQGFNVSSGIFKNHMDECGHFKKFLSKDVQGMLALYEATYMSVEGEKVLDDALEFTKLHLGNIAKDPSYDASLRIQIKESLKRPLRRRLPRLEALRYIHIYQQKASRDDTLVKLAKLDYNMLQSMHQRELSQICKWWKNLDMSNKLPYVRDRLVEMYFWILGVYFEPQHAHTRIFLVKTSMWLIVMDDTYDNYGTYEELEILTKAIERWSLSCLDVLPEYMKLIYEELINIFHGMEETLENEGNTNHIYYVKDLMKDYTRNLLVEAKWLKEGYMPTLEEHMSVSLVTCAYALMIATSYIGRGDVTQDYFKWVSTYPPIVKASCLILRIMDDIAAHKEEQDRNHVVSSVECYRNKFGVSGEDACESLSQKVENAWKVINRESLRPTQIPLPLLTPAINLARVCDVLYKVNDSYNHAGEEVIYYIKSLLVHTFVI
ncbi:hypothetical protein L1887_28937 [Cichorium endivia]|nr:hypothetical protein L1887_28937 [Cichorium endivia]